MKKKLLLACLVGLISITSAYAKCDGGTEITASSGTFCKSNVTMNWWSAAAWCKANGRTLATIYEMCPTWDGNTSHGDCLELKGSADDYSVWSATALDKIYAVAVHLSSGTVLGYDRSTAYRYAFCK